MFRKDFSEPKALNDFWKQLNDGAFEGLCDCLCTRFMEWMNDKIKPCFSLHSTLEQLRRYVFSTILGTLGRN